MKTGVPVVGLVDCSGMRLESQLIHWPLLAAF